jgi:hypothetical protein
MIQSQLPVQEYPDEFGVMVLGPFNGADLDTNLPIWVGDRDVIIDAAWAWAEVESEAGSSSVSSADTIQLFRGLAADGSLADMVAAARDITDAIAVDDGGYGYMGYTAFTIGTNSDGMRDENLIQAGEYVVLDPSGTLTNIKNLFVALRCRNRKN